MSPVEVLPDPTDPGGVHPAIRMETSNTITFFITFQPPCKVYLWPGKISRKKVLTDLSLWSINVGWEGRKNPHMFPLIGRTPMDNRDFPSLPIIDNLSEKVYSNTEAAGLINISARRVRQYAKNLGIGQQNTKKRWTYTLEEVTVMANLHKSYRRKANVLRNVTPRDSEELSRLINAEDGILHYLERELKKMKAEMFALIADVGRGYWNHTVAELDRHERLIYNLEERVKALKSEIENKEESGRGWSTLAGAATLTPNTYEATEAAA
jgi:hypothetical protein